VRDVLVAADSTSFRLETRTWGAVDVVTPLVGRHQATNAALAIGVCEHLGDALRPTPAQILEGVRGVTHHGRDQIVVLGQRTWLFDIAHNAAGAASLTDTLDRLELPRPLVMLVGVLGDKDWATMLPPLLARADHAILTQPPTAPQDRRWNPSEAALVFTADARPSVIEDFALALQEAEVRAGNGTVVVTGSVHTVGGAMRILGVTPLD
jgi:dihydrofolate synthase/folylpolyglutamate synthase